MFCVMSISPYIIDLKKKAGEEEERRRKEKEKRNFIDIAIGFRKKLSYGKAFLLNGRPPALW